MENLNDNNKNLALYQLFTKIYQKKFKIQAPQNSFNNEEQLSQSFLKNFGNIIHMKLVQNKSINKLIKQFVYLINSDNLFMQTCMQVIKAIMSDFCENCNSDALKLYMDQCGTPSRIEKENRQTLISQINNPWKEITPEFFQLICSSLTRSIEVHTLKYGQMNKTLYNSKVKQQEMNNKINLLNIDQAYFLIIFVNDVENYSNIQQQSKEDILQIEELNIQLLIQKMPQQPLQLYPSENMSPNIISTQSTPQQQFIEQSSNTKFQTYKQATNNNFLNQDKNQFNMSLQNNNNTSGINLTQINQTTKLSQDEVRSNNFLMSQNSSTNQLRSNQGIQQKENKYSYFEQTSSKLQIASTLQKSNMNNYKSYNNETVWNRNFLIGKTKELLFNMNLDSEKLNTLAKLNHSNNLNYSSSKENLTYHQPSLSPARQMIQNNTLSSLQQRLQKQNSQLKL